MMEETRFRVFFERTSKPLLAYLLHVAADRAVAEDTFQEAYVRLLQRDPGGLDDVRLKAYLFTTATNLLRDHWRRVKKERQWEAERVEAVSHREEAEDLRLSVEEALDEVSPRARSLLWLAYVEGYRHDEIAAMLNLQKSSVRVLLFRARRRMSDVLTSMGIRKEEPQ